MYMFYTVTAGAFSTSVAARSPNDALDAINGLDCCIISLSVKDAKDAGVLADYILPGGTEPLRRAIDAANLIRFGGDKVSKVSYYSITPRGAKQAVWVVAFTEKQLQDAGVATEAQYTKMTCTPPPGLVDFHLPADHEQLRSFLLSFN